MWSLIKTTLSVWTFVIVLIILWPYIKAFFIGLWNLFLAFVVVCLIIGVVKAFLEERSAKNKEKQKQNQEQDLEQ